jgi:hypothetical protein
MLPRKWEVALAALMDCPTIRDAAARCGASDRTMRRWLATPQFAAAFRERSRFILDGATGRLSAATGEAVETLRRNLTCGRSGDEIRAAATILTHAVQAVELADVLARLTELEAAFASKGDKP